MDPWKAEREAILKDLARDLRALPGPWSLRRAVRVAERASGVHRITPLIEAGAVYATAFCVDVYPVDAYTPALVLDGDGVHETCLGDYIEEKEGEGVIFE